jgi:hypothetical protein
MAILTWGILVLPINSDRLGLRSSVRAKFVYFELPPVIGGTRLNRKCRIGVGGPIWLPTLNL